MDNLVPTLSSVPAQVRRSLDFGQHHQQQPTSTTTTAAGYASSTAPSASGSSQAPLSSAHDMQAYLMDAFKASVAEVDSYLGLFESRAKLEEEFVKGLKALNEKQREVDVKVETRLSSAGGLLASPQEMPGARRAWKELRDNDMRELDTRLHFIETLRQAVIAPLQSFRDSQERIRKRCKEDLKVSIQRYEEMRNVTLPKAKRTYEKKCEEVEHLRLQQQAIDDQRALLASSSLGRSGSLHAGSALQDDAYGDGDEDSSSPPISPRRALSQREPPALPPRRYSGASVSSREDATSPRLQAAALSTSPPLDRKSGQNFFDALRTRDGWDAARKEAPKKLGAFLNRMREGSSSGDRAGPGTASFSPPGESTLGGFADPNSGRALSIKGQQNVTLKAVKAKREAAEADKAYRKAIFDLETLRLRRSKTIAAASKSVQECRQELYLTCQAVWLQSERSALVLSSSGVSLHAHAEEVVTHALDRIDVELERLEKRLPSPEMLEEEHTPYVNYWHGEFKDLLFGVSLIDYDFARAQHSAPQLGPQPVEPPRIVTKCIAWIEEHALDHPGIYRISAKQSAIQELCNSFEKDEARVELPASLDPSLVAGTLKSYLRQLPEPLFPIPWEERIRMTIEREEHMRQGFSQLKSRIRRLPTINQVTLKAIVEHLAKVAAHSERNKMGESNLSVVFGPVLLSESDHETTSIAAAVAEDKVMEDLLLFSDTIFDLKKSAPALPRMTPTSGATKIDFEAGADYGSTDTAPESAATSLTAAPPLAAPSVNGANGSISLGAEVHTAMRGATSNSDRPIVVAPPQLSRSNAISVGSPALAQAYGHGRTPSGSMAAGTTTAALAAAGAAAGAGATVIPPTPPAGAKVTPTETPSVGTPTEPTPPTRPQAPSLLSAGGPPSLPETATVSPIAPPDEATKTSQTAASAALDPAQAAAAAYASPPRAPLANGSTNLVPPPPPSAGPSIEEKLGLVESQAERMMLEQEEVDVPGGLKPSEDKRGFI